MSAPFIDVVVPTYNRAALLERLVPSLLEQDYPGERYRVIVVDDGSPDRTRAALEEMARRDRRLEPLGIAHAGASAARNHGWRDGTGEIVAFTDDDCVADRGWLAALARGFAERPDALGIYGKTVTDPARVTPLTHQIVADRPNANYRGCNIAYRREALAAAGGFDEASAYGEDTQLAAAVLARGPILFRPDAVIVHPPRPRDFLDREKWRPELEGLYRLASRQPDFFRRHWGRYFPLAVAWRLGVGSTAKHALIHAPWLVRDPPVYLEFLTRLLRERAVLLAMLPGFWREQVKRSRTTRACAGPRPAPVRLLGVAVHPLAWEDLKGIIVEAVENERGWIIANHNLHSVYLYHHDAGFRAFYERADWVHIDGMSLVFLGRLLGLPLGRVHRLTYLDWIHPLLAEAARRRWRIFYLGARPGVAERGAEILRRAYPGLAIETGDGYFDPRQDGAENRRAVEAIARFRPDLLLVGMGMPRQERWIVENAGGIRAGAVFNAGALMDYIAGEEAPPPRWLGRLGLEWLFRLFGDPARLWRRYLVEPWFVVKILLAERFGRKAGARAKAG